MIVVPEWTGAEARALRKALRMTMERFSEHLGAAVRTVADWEKLGAQIVPIPVMQACLDTALSRADDEAKARFAALTSDVTGKMSDSSDRNGNGDHADRRTATRAFAAGFAAAAFPLDALERITDHGDRPVDSKLITAHEDLADALAVVHRTMRPDVLFGPVAQQANMQLRLLDRSMSEADRHRLDAIVVASHVQAGLLAFNIADRAEARRHFATAKSVADDADDATLCARTLTAACVLYSPIPTGGRGGNLPRAMALTRQAAALSRHADPATRAHAHRELGLHLAVDGDERGFFSAFEAAEALPEPHRQLDGHGFFARHLAMSAERVSLRRGTGLVWIGRAKEAVDALEVALVPADPRLTVGALADIAAARVLQGDPEQACAELSRALDPAVDAGYTMGVQRILGVRARFPTNWADLPCVAELDERLRALTAR